MRRFILLFALFILSIPVSLHSTLTGGDFEIYADSFSTIPDDGSTGSGVYDLLGSSAETGGGIIQQAATGLIDVNIAGIAFVLDETFILSDGLVTRTFFFQNAGGVGNAVLVGERIRVDTGGGATADTMASRIAAAINSSAADIDILATADGDQVVLVNTSGIASGNTDIIETVDNASFTVSGMSGGGTYRLRGGFSDLEITSVGLSVNDATVSLGTLSQAAVSESGVTLTLSTDSATGYQVVVSEDHDLRTDSLVVLDDVLDGAVTAGQEEYGIRTTGDDGQYNNADQRLTTAGGTLAYSQEKVSGEQVVVLFRASVGSESRAGNYSHNVTFTMTANP